MDEVLKNPFILSPIINKYKIHTKSHEFTPLSRNNKFSLPSFTVWHVVLSSSKTPSALYGFQFVIADISPEKKREKQMYIDISSR